MWTNWAQNQTSPAKVAYPESIAALSAAVSGRNGTVRVAGAGHSFTPLIADGSLIVRLDALSDNPVLFIGDGRARVRAGARLFELSQALSEHGMAFRNLGDINVQTLAGAMSTATHGTGSALPCISAEMMGGQILTSDGDLVELTSEDLPGAQVSLGLLGVLTEIEMRTVPAYDLYRRVSLVSLNEALTNMHRLWAEHRHFEYFWLPWTGKALCVVHDQTDQARDKPPVDLDNLALSVMRFARGVGRVSPRLRKLLLRLLLSFQGDDAHVGEAWRVLSKPRNRKFVEMEYHLPPSEAKDVLSELASMTQTRFADVYFPVEVRQTAGDGAWLSPFQGGNRVSIAVHGHAKEDNASYFDAAEKIFRAAGGRPHWGKLHSLTRKELEPLYPDLGRFDQLRQRLDPKGKFLSPAMARLLT